MRQLSYSFIRANLSSAMDDVVNDCIPTVITRRNGKNCILLSLDEYSSLEETAKLFRSPANANHLLSSLEQVKNGKLEKIDLPNE